MFKKFNLEEGVEIEILVMVDNELLLCLKLKLIEFNEELCFYFKMLFLKVKDNKWYEEIDFGMEGNELF